MHNWNASNDVECLHPLINMQRLNRKIYDFIRIILCDSKRENIRRNYFILPSFLRWFSSPFRLVFGMEFLRDSHFMIDFYDWHFHQSEPFIRSFWHIDSRALIPRIYRAREREKFPVGERILRLLHMHFFDAIDRPTAFFIPLIPDYSHHIEFIWPCSYLLIPHHRFYDDAIVKRKKKNSWINQGEQMLRLAIA